MPKYNEDILNYYNDDSHVGTLDANAKNVGTGMIGSPSCGDVMKLQIQVGENQKIEDAKVLVFGCGSAKASSSYVAEKLVGMTLEEAGKVKNTDIAEALGLPRIKLHCSVLAEGAIKKAIENYKEKNGLLTKTESKEKESKKFKILPNFSLKITDEAVDFVKNTLQKLEQDGKINDVQGIRLTLDEGNCGLMYKVKYVEKEEDTSTSYDFEAKGLHIFVAHEIGEIVDGTEITYKEENMKRGLIFHNPKEKGRCACGMNFYTDEKNKKQSSCK